MGSVIRVFIGYDKREAVAYHVCQQSIIETASDPGALRFTPITGEQRDGSNAFIYARFLVPYLCQYQGWAIFLDGDMLVRRDIAELWALKNERHAVKVVKHDYRTRHPVKYLGYKNEDYPRKNWSSVVLWNCAHAAHRVLKPQHIAGLPGAYLHRFQWLRDDEIGALPATWNRLVLEQEILPDDNLLHYTIGTPCFKEYAAEDGAEEWHAAYQRTIAPCS